MAPRAANLNTITTAGRTMLLTQTGGVAIHLISVAADNDDPQPAIPSRTWPSSPTDDTFTDLTDRRWAPRTLCGIRWNTMAGIASTGAGTDDDRTPTCRRCLAILDRWFPEPVPDDRIAILAELAPVPSTSTAPQRSSACPAINTARYVAPHAKHSGNDTDTAPRPSSFDDRVVISSNDTTEALRAEMAAQFHQAFSSHDDDDAPIDDSTWRFHWRTWSTT